MHETTSAPFLIAARETTFEDWIAFLEALPASLRAQYIRKFPRNGFTGTLSLSQAPEGWKLEFQPPKQKSYTAIRGEKINYEGRQLNKTMNWLKFPATGISYNEALEYAKWLSDTGRVPGARLCTEYEWERAARGADAREYPHGDTISPSEANYYETYAPNGVGPDEVGIHPQSGSPFGVLDLSGNAWEWTAQQSGMDTPVLRGGSYSMDEISSLVTTRELWEANMRDATVGLRICRDP